MQMDCKASENWFESWFDSKYYPILYANRDQSEAALFIDRLVDFLKVKPNSSVLDLACGKGRHSIHLHSKGLDVMGIDLSPNSIAEAKKSATSGLDFSIEDMRTFDLHRKFDFVFNLFTSFGYFNHQDENLNVLKRVFHHLNDGGTMVLDYFNATKVEKALIPHDVKKAGGIDFEVSKQVKDGCIYKQIHFVDGEKEFTFTEQVQLLHLSDFIRLFESAGFKVNHTFGNYLLEPFNVESSDRLILVCSR
jgi:cyclopropane fatty-acyl-phospholipid synthase-like methyltransferase